MNTYSDAVPPWSNITPKHTRGCTGDSGRSTSEGLPHARRRCRAGRRAGTAHAAPHKALLGFSNALAAYSRHGVQLPRAPSLTVEDKSAVSARTRRRASPRHRRHCHTSPAASRAEESVSRVRGQATGAVGVPGMDARGGGWTPGCRLTARACKLKVVAAAQQCHPVRPWRSEAPATRMCACLSTFCTKASTGSFRARHSCCSGELHACRADSRCSGLVGVGTGKGWAPWGR